MYCLVVSCVCHEYEAFLAQVILIVYCTSPLSLRAVQKLSFSCKKVCYISWSKTDCIVYAYKQCIKKGLEKVSKKYGSWAFFGADPK